jgi:hypothetical protein
MPGGGTIPTTALSAVTDSTPVGPQLHRRARGWGAAARVESKRGKGRHAGRGSKQRRHAGTGGSVRGCRPGRPAAGTWAAAAGGEGWGGETAAGCSGATGTQVDQRRRRREQRRGGRASSGWTLTWQAVSAAAGCCRPPRSPPAQSPQPRSLRTAGWAGTGSRQALQARDARCPAAVAGNALRPSHRVKRPCAAHRRGVCGPKAPRRVLTEAPGCRPVKVPTAVSLSNVSTGQAAQEVGVSVKTNCRRRQRRGERVRRRRAWRFGSRAQPVAL